MARRPATRGSPSLGPKPILPPCPDMSLLPPHFPDFRTPRPGFRALPEEALYHGAFSPVKGAPGTPKILPKAQCKPSIYCILVHPRWTERAARSPHQAWNPRPGVFSASPESRLHPPLPPISRLQGQASSPSPSTGARRTRVGYSPSWLLSGASTTGAWGLGSSLLCS